MYPTDEIGLFEALYSARAQRRFRPDPVPDELISRILEAAIQAPSGGNRQQWLFIVVKDHEQRRRLAAIYRKASEVVAAFYAERVRPAHLDEAEYRRMLASGSYLYEHMDEAPVLLVPCIRTEALKFPPIAQSLDQAALGTQIDRTKCASIYPAVQNIILACRALGLGTVITTNHLICEDEVRQALELPPDIQTHALMPIGYPRAGYGPVRRRPVSEVAMLDRFGTAWKST
ncbi:MAG: nitroreductase family protein [Candidatus Binataceae bacterium]